MAYRENFVSLAEKNTALLEKIGFNSGRDDPFELDNPEIFRASGLFPDGAIDCIFNERPYLPAQTNEKIAPTIGMLLLRPDMVQIAPQVEAFISRQFQLLDVSTPTVSPDHYWTMYGDAVVGRETRQSRLTRAAVYIGSPCRLFVFKDAAAKSIRTPVADRVFAEMKGKQGQEQKGTLRGDLVYNEALRTGLHTLENPEIALATDPFGAYRKVVETQAKSPCHTLRYPLLFFTGVGVHVPNHSEMQRDLTSLMEAQNIEAYAA